MRAAAHGSLMGARGNSGVILSQIFRGFAQGVGDRERLDAAGVADCLSEGARVAYKAVMKPTEGTILTVVREAAEAAQRAAASSPDIRTVLEETVREAHAPSSGPSTSSRCSARPAWSTPAASGWR